MRRETGSGPKEMCEIQAYIASLVCVRTRTKCDKRVAVVVVVGRAYLNMYRRERRRAACWKMCSHYVSNTRMVRS